MEEKAKWRRWKLSRWVIHQTGFHPLTPAADDIVAPSSLFLSPDPTLGVLTLYVKESGELTFTSRQGELCSVAEKPKLGCTFLDLRNRDWTGVGALRSCMKGRNVNQSWPTVSMRAFSALSVLSVTVFCCCGYRAVLPRCPCVPAGLVKKSLWPRYRCGTACRTFVRATAEFNTDLQVNVFGKWSTWKGFSLSFRNSTGQLLQHCKQEQLRDRPSSDIYFSPVWPYIAQHDHSEETSVGFCCCFDFFLCVFLLIFMTLIQILHVSLVVICG